MWYSHSMNLVGLANALVKREKAEEKPSALSVTKAIQAATQTAKPKAATETRNKTEVDTELARKDVLNKLFATEQRA